MRPIFFSLLFSFLLNAEGYPQNGKPILLKPDRVFDGHEIRAGYWVLIDSGKI